MVNGYWLNRITLCDAQYFTQMIFESFMLIVYNEWNKMLNFINYIV